MRPYILSESNWKTVRNQSIELVVLPWGACEAHNYHLPYGTDIYEADYISAEAARKACDHGASITVLPTIPFGVNTGQTDIRLDINMYPSTQQAILHDVIEVLDRQGFRKLLVFNSHGGNSFKTMLRELGVKYPRMFLSSCDWFNAMDRKEYFENDGDHAEEMETSLILHFRPDLVLPLDQAGDGSEKKIKVKGIRDGWAWAERRWSQVSMDTGIGDPSKASAQKGQRFFDDLTDRLAELFVELVNLDLDNMYE